MFFLGLESHVEGVLRNEMKTMREYEEHSMLKRDQLILGEKKCFCVHIVGALCILSVFIACPLPRYS